MIFAGKTCSQEALPRRPVKNYLDAPDSMPAMGQKTSGIEKPSKPELAGSR